MAELALSRLFAQIKVGLVVGSMVGLMDPANRMETWEDEEGEEEKSKMVSHSGQIERMHAKYIHYYFP